MTGWYPWGEHRDEHGDFDPFDARYMRISPRIKETLDFEIANLHIVIWHQGRNEDDEDPYVEICGMGYGGYAGKSSLAELIDRELSYHTVSCGGIDAEMEIIALQDLHKSIYLMIEKRMKALELREVSA